MKYITILFLFVQFHQGIGQHFIGASASTANVNLDQWESPANIAENKYAIGVNLGSVDVHFQNSYAKWAAPFGILKFSTFSVPDKYKNASGDKILWYNTYIKTRSNKMNSKVYLNGELRGPFISFKMGKWGVGVGLRFRYLNSISQLSPDLGEILVRGPAFRDNINKTFDNTSGTLNSTYINQYTFSLGRTYINEGDRIIKWGFNLNALGTNQASYYKVTAASYKSIVNNLDPKRADLIIDNFNASTVISSKYNSLDVGNFINQMTSIPTVGQGLSADLGIIIESRPDYREFTRFQNGETITNEKKIKYKYKLSISLSDLGFLNFKSTSISNYINLNKTIKPKDYPAFNGLEDLSNFSNGFWGSTQSSGTSLVFMPAMIRTRLDYNVFNNLFINVYSFQRILHTERKGPSLGSGFFISPRLEKKNIEVTTPIGLIGDYKVFSMGLGARFSRFFIGSDNIMGFFNLGKPGGLSFYTGLSFGIRKKEPKSPLKCP